MSTKLDKQCARCKRFLPLGAFPLKGRTPNGIPVYRGSCKDCRSLKQTKPRYEIDETDDESYSEREAVEIRDPQLLRLFTLAKKPVAFSELCDKLDVAPARLRKLIDKANSSGIPLRVEHDHVGAQLPSEREDVQDSEIPPVVGERQRIAVISDTHFGSKYCLRGAIKDFIDYAYSRGVREVLHPGDMVDGDYSHGKFEMTHMGITNQARDMIKNLPAKPGLTYHAITGNHDFTFTEKTGLNVGKFLEDYFHAAGRSDFKCYGDRGAFVQIRGVLFHLWHPKAGPGYARSYTLQRKVESYSPGSKPQVLLTGHWHFFCYVEERGVHAIACPTFQAGGSAYGRSLTSGDPSIGGLILEFDLTEDGTMRNFSIEKRTYFKRETVHRVDRPQGIEVIR